MMTMLGISKENEWGLLRIGGLRRWHCWILTVQMNGICYIKHDSCAWILNCVYDAGRNSAVLVVRTWRETGKWTEVQILTKTGMEWPLFTQQWCLCSIWPKYKSMWNLTSRYVDYDIQHCSWVAFFWLQMYWKEECDNQNLVKASCWEEIINWTCSYGS